ncbi:MAG: START domain-containing protein [Gammaproteobacteria bacterium]|nr:START domain-containing protein [Gammaproteobacteria bacterium]
MIVRLLLALWLSCCSVLATAAEWTSVSERDGIAVWTRRLPGAPLKDFRGRMDVDKPLGAVVAVLTDFPAYAQWFLHMREARVLEGTSLADVSIYLVIDGVWPVRDRDAVARAEVSQESDTLATRMMLLATPRKIPPVAGRVRMPILQSGWELTPLSPTATRIEVIGSADPGGSIPRWLANAAVVMMPRETLKGLRRQLALPKYANPDALFARDPLLRDLRAYLRMPGDIP